MKAIWEDKIIAESDETIVIEGNHYFPSDSIKEEFFEKSDHTTICYWKGVAHYYNVVIGDKRNEGSVDKAGHNFAGYVAFWNGVTIE